MKILGLIPARGGSKGVPRKNIRPLAGKPLIVYTIKEALKSKYLSMVVTSSEDEEILRIAQEAGSMIIRRPKELAEDDTPMLPVVKHAISIVEEELGGKIDYVILLQPTSPLRKREDIDNALEKLIATGSDSVVSLYRIYSHHPHRMKRIVNDMLLPYYEEEVENIGRGDLPQCYYRNGAIYAVRRDCVMEENTLFGKVSRPYIMSRERSVNIDEEMDFILAEALLSMINRRECE